MSDKSKTLVIQLNSEGRPCGWGLIDGTDSAAVDAARAEADRQWEAHCCYCGERKGRVVVHQLTVDSDEESR